MHERQERHTSPRFRELVAANQRAVYALARRLTGNHHDAEDLAQDVFIRAYRGFEGYRGDASAMAWLHRITVNTFLAGRRKKTSGLVQPREHAGEMDAANGVPPDAAADAGVIRREVERAMDALSPQERTAFVLRFSQDYAVKDIAETMELAEGTVKSVLFRAVRKLRASLGPMVRELS